MHPVRVGTCGWSYKEWSGRLLPPGPCPGEYLAYVAQHFLVVDFARLKTLQT
jgi:uncharacterized protein YecE (DUF72 family)